MNNFVLRLSRITTKGFFVLFSGQIDLSDANVARYIKKAIDEFRKTNPKYLKQVDVVIFEQRMLGAFQSAFGGSASAPLKGNAPKITKTKPAVSIPIPAPRRGNVAVRVTSGDVLTSNCEVMINTTGGDFNLTGGRISSYSCFWKDNYDRFSAVAMLLNAFERFRVISNILVQDRQNKE